MESTNKLTMCRLCLCENECLVNIFELNDLQDYVAAEVISDFLQFQVSETDGYPHVVCSSCLMKLTDFKLFKECCQKSKVMYDEMFVSSASTAKLQQEMPIIKQEELDIDCTFRDGSDEPFEDFNDEPILKQEELDIDCTFVDGSDKPFEGFNSENDMEPLRLESDDERIDSVEKERENETAPEKGFGNSRERFECYHCGNVFTTKSHLRRHTTSHGFEKSYNSEEEEEGRKGTVAEKRIGRRNDMFECHCCRKLLMTKTGLKGHLATHGIGDFFKCDVCGKIAVSKWNLIRHTQQHTGEKPYKCTDCSALFRYCSNLKVHMRLHTNIKSFKCMKCNMRFNYSSVLKVHMRLHSNLKPYSCSVCHAAFRQKSHLTIHARTHSGDRPYKCTVCSKAFSQGSSLRKHQVVHSGEKPHPCPHCNKRFSLRQHLKRHLKTVCV